VGSAFSIEFEKAKITR